MDIEYTDDNNLNKHKLYKKYFRVFLKKINDNNIILILYSPKNYYSILQKIIFY